MPRALNSTPRNWCLAETLAKRPTGVVLIPRDGQLTTDHGHLDALATNRISFEGRLPGPSGAGGAARTHLAAGSADGAHYGWRTSIMPGNRRGTEVARRLPGSRPDDRLHP